MMFSWWRTWDSLAHTYGYDAPRNQMRYMLYETPFYGHYIKFAQGMKDAQDYLDNRGLSWADADRVGNLPGAGSVYNMISSPLKTNYVSKNILALYR